MKKRKVSTCTYCGLRVKGNDHSKCKEKREAAVDEFRTPVAQVLHSVACKPFVPAKDSRAKRKHRKKRCHKSSVVSADEFQSRMRAL
jgi:hypothetical protein